MRFADRPLTVVACGCLIVASTLLSQERQGTGESKIPQSGKLLRTNTRLVIVDVVAVDAKGEPVRDLKAADFDVLENGIAQKISGFSYQGGAAKGLGSSQLPSNIVTNTPQFKSSSLDVILFDTVNGDFAELAYARDELLRFLRTTELDQPVAVYALQSDLKLLNDFTMDNKLLISAISKYKPPIQNLNTESMESRVSAFSSAGAYHTSERNIENTLNQLNVLAKVLKGYPGRKNLIWLSESFPLTLFPESITQANQNGQSLRSTESATAAGPRAAARGNSGDVAMNPNTVGGGLSAHENLQTAAPYKTYAALIKKVADALMAAQVAVYVVDAGAVGKNDHLASQHTMNVMAESTGGKAFKNSNDLALGLKTSVEDGSAYYTLEYYPENRKWDGQFRAIQVKSSRPGVSLRYRQGYYALDPEKINKEDSDAVAENFSRLLELDAPAVTGVLFQAQVLADKSKKVQVTFHVDPQTVVFEHKNDGKEYAKVSCSVWAYGKDKEKPAMFSGTVNASLPENEYQQIMKQKFLPCNRELDLKPGSYNLRLGVLDRTTNKIGTATAQVVVP